MILDEGFNNLSRKQTEKKCIAESTKTRSNKTTKDWKKNHIKKTLVCRKYNRHVRTRSHADTALRFFTSSSSYFKFQNTFCADVSLILDA